MMRSVSKNVMHRKIHLKRYQHMRGALYVRLVKTPFTAILKPGRAGVRVLHQIHPADGVGPNHIGYEKRP